MGLRYTMYPLRSIQNVSLFCYTQITGTKKPAWCGLMRIYIERGGDVRESSQTMQELRPRAAHQRRLLLSLPVLGIWFDMLVLGSIELRFL